MALTEDHLQRDILMWDSFSEYIIFKYNIYIVIYWVFLHRILFVLQLILLNRLGFYFHGSFIEDHIDFFYYNHEFY